MEFTVYKFTKRNNSTKRPTNEPQIKLDGWHKKTTSIYSPTFTVTQRLVGYSYLTWENMYYYITDIVFIRKDYYELVCELDVLATYKENILNTTAFVLYSTSNVNLQIPDTRYSMVNAPTIKSSNSVLLDDGSNIMSEGMFLLNYVTSQPTYGASGSVYLTYQQCIDVTNILASSGFSEWLNNAQKQFMGAYDSLLGCLYFPFKWNEFLSATKKIVLGGYDTNIMGIEPVNTRYNIEVTIPWAFNDFRNMPPYTSLIVFLPAYGFVELNPADYIGKTKIPVNLLIDGITGSGTYIVGENFRATTSFATPINIGTIKSNTIGATMSALSTVGAVAGGIAASVASGGLAAPAAIGGAASIATMAANTYIAAQQRSLGSIGSNGGTASIFQGPNLEWTKVYCIIIAHDTAQTVGSFNHINGGICNQVLSLNSLSGYCQTINASVNTPNLIASNKINSMLDGGIYIE